MFNESKALAVARKYLLHVGVILTMALSPAATQAQEDLSAHWNGQWYADGTLFTLAIEVIDEVMHITKIETLGFEWTNEFGVVEGNVATVEVAYAGVNGTVQVELIDADTAIAFAATCMPDYMVVCALAKDQQAVFRRVGTP